MKMFLLIRERIPANVGSDKVDAGTVREMAGVGDLLLISGEPQLNCRLSDSSSTTHS